jgi:hypothetical protein
MNHDQLVEKLPSDSHSGAMAAGPNLEFLSVPPSLLQEPLNRVDRMDIAILARPAGNLQAGKLITRNWYG